MFNQRMSAACCNNEIFTVHCDLHIADADSCAQAALIAHLRFMHIDRLLEGSLQLSQQTRLTNARIFPEAGGLQRGTAKSSASGNMQVVSTTHTCTLLLRKSAKLSLPAGGLAVAGQTAVIRQVVVTHFAAVVMSRTPAHLAMAADMRALRLPALRQSTAGLMRLMSMRSLCCTAHHVIVSPISCVCSHQEAPFMHFLPNSICLAGVMLPQLQTQGHCSCLHFASEIDVNAVLVLHSRSSHCQPHESLFLVSLRESLDARSAPCLGLCVLKGHSCRRMGHTFCQMTASLIKSMSMLSLACPSNVYRLCLSLCLVPQQLQHE